jgi:DNA polymerase-1
MSLPPTQWSAEEYHRNLLAPVGIVTNAMERTGVPVDPDKLRAIEADMAAKAVGLRAELKQWCGRDINWNSWQQLAKWMHDDKEDGGLGMAPSPYCKKGEVPDDKISTDDRALEWLAGHNPEHRAGIQTLRSLRTHERMGRYARSWLAVAIPHPDGTWRLHPSFGLASDRDNRPGAKTGRFGVKNPALNQVPTRTDAAGELGVPKDPAYIRRAFVAPAGKKLVVVDYSQLEIVLLAHDVAYLFGPDDPMVERVRAGRDIHGPLAQMAFGVLAGDQEVIAANEAAGDFKKIPKFKLLRELGKAGIYGKNYGKGRRGFANSVFLPSGEPLGERRADLLVDGLDKMYPGTNKFQQFIREFIEREGLIVSPFGRWYPLPNARAKQTGLRNRAWRQALNYPMQAGGQEVMALALIAIYNDPRLRELGYEILMVVHDEIMGMAPEENAAEALAIVEYHMTHVVDLLCPLRAEGAIGHNWKDTKK